MFTKLSGWRSILIALPFGVVGLVVLLAPVPMPAQGQVRHFDLDAQQFEFAPSRLEVNYGDTVIITFTASDVVHGFYLDGYGIEQRTTPGISQQIEFVADQVGKFHYRCSVSCGSLHPFMIGDFVVEPNIPFWRVIGVLAIALVGLFVNLRQRKDIPHAEP